MPYIPVAYVDEIPPGTLTAIRPLDSPFAITVVNVGGTIYAFETLCTHGAYFLADGFLDDHEVTCPGHFGAFDVRTGEATQPPAYLPLKTFPVRITGKDVEVDLPPF